MLRILTAVCLALSLTALCRGGEFADTMEDELIFLPGDGGGALSPQASEPFVAGEPYVVSGGIYDRLPRFFGEMNQYDRIAMGPFKDTYDSMSLKEKAEVYAKQFEYMNNRKPNFSPRVLDEIDGSTDAFAAKKYLYKPPPRKKPKEEPKPVDLGALPGPWAANAPPVSQPMPEPVSPDDQEYTEFYTNPDGTITVPPDRRMETLREGWDVRRMLRKK